MTLPPSLAAERVIPVARGLNATSAPRLVGALVTGGLHTIEITVEAGGGLDAISSVVGGEVTVGAGTIATIDQANRAVDAGAEFLVSPHADPELIDWAAMAAVPFIPGAFTPTEVVAAAQHQPPAVKLFPAHVGGPEYVRSLLGPYPDLRLIPTGGIDGENAGDFLAAGAIAVGVGGWLTAHADLGLVTERAAQLVSQVV